MKSIEHMLLFVIIVGVHSAQAQIFDADTIFTEEEKAHIYEHSKIVINHMGNIFEFYEDYLVLQLFQSHHCGSDTWLIRYWNAYQADSSLSEKEFFSTIGFLEKAADVKNYRNSLAIMKWSSPFLIVGGVLLSGFSSQWGQASEGVLPVVGVGVSVVGIIFGVESLSKSSKNRYDLFTAISSMDYYNKSLKKKLGIDDPTPIVRTGEFDIQSIMDSLGIEIVPYNMLDTRIHPKDWFGFGNVPKPPFGSGQPTKIVVDVLIDTTGKVVESRLVKSGGISLLDRKVYEVTKRMEFNPPRKNKKCVYTIHSIPFRFFIYGKFIELLKQFYNENQ